MVDLPALAARVEALADGSRVPFLTPCPFCGAEPIWRRGHWGGPSRPELFAVDCSNCGAQIGTQGTVQAAVDRWETRAVLRARAMEGRPRSCASAHDLPRRQESRRPLARRS